MSFSPLFHSKSVTEGDEMEDAPLLSLLAEGCEGTEFAEGGTVRPGPDHVASFAWDNARQTGSLSEHST
jgi:hypothetical protein